MGFVNALSSGAVESMRYLTSDHGTELLLYPAPGADLTEAARRAARASGISVGIVTGSDRI